MDIVVLSDTHGRADRVTELMRRTRCSILLFLGDGLRDLNVVRDDVTVRAVRGNCDFFGEDIPTERIEIFGTYRIFMTHGHRYGVKHSLESAVASAANADADVLLYGHTHVPFEKTYPVGALVGGIELKKPLLVLCPGSLGDPRDGQPTFATLTLRDNGILPNIAKF